MVLQEKCVKFWLNFKNLTLDICIATNNTHKTEEIIPLLGDNYKLLTLEEAGVFSELPENQSTLEGNAEEKAEYVFHAIGISCFADDTGLEVHALYGEPGVYSARYAGAHRSDSDNMNLLLKNMHSISDRSARFRTVICWISGSTKLFFEGILEGRIAQEPHGNHGFGYDPIFIPKGYDISLAEMNLEQKNQISHRAKAVEKLVSYLKQLPK